MKYSTIQSAAILNNQRYLRAIPKFFYGTQMTRIQRIYADFYLLRLTNHINHMKYSTIQSAAILNNQRYLRAISSSFMEPG